MDINLSLKEMAQNGLHFGHPTHRWNPKMKPYLYGKRNGIHIFDLQKTAAYFGKALEYMDELASKRKSILFVGTKQQAHKILSEIREETRMPVVMNKWMPGLLTNFRTLKKRIRHFVDSKKTEQEGGFEKYTKKEQVKIRKEILFLENAFSGVQDMADMPDAIFIVDIVRDNIALREARRMKIPVIAIVDSNADPDMVNFPIPANDDAVKSVNYILNLIKQVLVDAKKAKK